MSDDLGGGGGGGEGGANDSLMSTISGVGAPLTSMTSGVGGPITSITVDGWPLSAIRRDSTLDSGEGGGLVASSRAGGPLTST